LSSLQRSLRRAEPSLISLYAISSFLILFLVLPLISLYMMFSPRVAEKIFSSPEMTKQVRDAFITSITASLIAVAILTLLGVPLAYILARHDFRGKGLIETIIDVPFVMPHAVAGIMILAAYSHRGVFGSLTSSIGLRIQDAFAGIVAVMIFVSAPILVDTVKAGIASIDPMLEAVARSLGASPLRAFIDIIVPMTLRHIIAGIILAWARALSEVGALLIVAYYPMTINILIIEYMNIYGLSYAVVLSVLFASLAIALFASLRAVIKK